MQRGSSDPQALREIRLANIRPYTWRKGTSGNPAGKKARRSRHRETVAALTADLGGNLGSIDRALVEQAAWFLVMADDLQRARNGNKKPVSDEEMTRAANGAARILMRLRETRSSGTSVVDADAAAAVNEADVVDAALRQLGKTPVE